MCVRITLGKTHLKRDNMVVWWHGTLVYNINIIFFINSLTLSHTLKILHLSIGTTT